MKRRFILLVLAILMGISIIPAINLSLMQGKDLRGWSDKSIIFNMDMVSQFIENKLYPLGISIDSRQVVIGYRNWLYLGDEYENTLTVDRRIASVDDLTRGEEIGRATKNRAQFLAMNGVKVFKVMLCPNKGSIYKDYMPFWARPVFHNATDALLAGVGSENYIDLRPPLLAARKNDSVPLYYKTDTHWNFMGAGLAFRYMAQQISRPELGIQWPNDDAYELVRVDPRQGGDLAKFLRMQNQLDDEVPIPKGVVSQLKSIREPYDKEMESQCGEKSCNAELIRTDDALNSGRVLWLRDSFGEAMLPFMASTFSQILQMHWNVALQPDGPFLKLIKEWKPDYVFITVVERAATNRLFSLSLPLENDG